MLKFKTNAVNIWLIMEICNKYFLRTQVIEIYKFYIVSNNAEKPVSRLKF